LALAQIVPLSTLTQVAHAQQVQPTQYGYDAQGNLTQITDPNLKVTDLTRDNLDRVQLQQLPKPTAAAVVRPSISYTYDGQNRLVIAQDPRNVKFNYAYGGLNDVLMSQRDFGSLTSIVNEGGLQYYSTNTRGKSVWVSLTDKLNRPTDIRYFDENTLVTSGHTKLNYDAYSTASGAENYGIGRLTSVIDYLSANNSLVSNSVSMRYDQLGRLTWRCQFWAGVSAGSASACTDADALKYRWASNTSPTDAGRLVGLTYPSGRMVDYQYDSLGRVTAVTTTDPNGSTATTVVSSLTYSPLALAQGGYALTGWTFGSGSATPVQTYSRSYDTSGRLSGFTLGAGASGLTSGQANYSLVLDDAGRITEIDTQSATGTTLSNVYGYDDLNRLLQATMPGGVSYSYDYDGNNGTGGTNGNRTLTVSGGVSTSYTYPSNSNRLSSVKVGSATSQTLTTDQTGNVTLDPAALVGQVSYTYDDRSPMPYGRLSRSQGPGAQWDYLHNFFGQRIRKTGSSYTPSGGSAITPSAYVGSTDTLFYYDAAGHLIAEVDASVGAVSGPKPVKREYIWLGDTLVAVIAGSTPTAAVDASSNAPAIYYVHSDHLGTPRMVTDTAGSLRWSWDLMAAEPFGVTAPNEAPAGQASTQQFALNLRFPGQYLDKETGSFYNYFRTYNPSTGRYLQSDPIGLEGGLNTYTYVGGNPMSFTDPQGKFLVGVVGAGVGAAIGFGSSVLTQLVQNEGNWSCVNWGNAGWSAATGGAAGLLLTTPLGGSWAGVLGVGSGSNLLNYGLTTSPNEYSATGAGAAALSGAAGGLIGGKAPNPYMFIKSSPSLSDVGLAAQMLGAKLLAMAGLGGVVGSYDYTKGLPSRQDCGCK
jgi:RHS repeat-associated protein